MPLYLEMAPVGTFDKKKAAVASAALSQKKGTATATAAKEKESKESSAKKQTAEKEKAAKDSSAVDPEEDNTDEYSTLFIKNLAFSTTEANLRDHLNHLRVEGCRTLSIQKKTTSTGMVLSQGFGFAEFNTYKNAQEALLRLNGSMLDSYKLIVAPSDKRLTIVLQNKKTNTANTASSSGAAKNNENGTNNKIIVRNLAFQATKHELHALFAAFGSVKKVRIPKKMGGDHRGFAFVDFSTAQEAATAVASLKDTHLYGRHLVIEYAQEEDEEQNVLSRGVGAAQLSNRVGGSGGAGLEALRKRARADEQVIRTENKRQRAKESIDDTAIGGGIGSDDI